MTARLPAPFPPGTRLGALLCALAAAPALPQEAPSQLQKLLETPVQVASRAPLPLRETPGVVTVISREEIQASGAQDLLQVLRLVPGFDVASDVQGQIGPSVRGIWAYEGKLLLLWDGIELTELLYGEMQMGSRYPVDQIARIEIVRGPGSVIHGDNAEVAVVKVISLEADQLPRLGAGFLQAQGSRRPLLQGFQLVSGGVGGALEWKVGGYIGTGQRGQGPATDSLGASYEMAGQSGLRPLFLHAGLTWGDLKAQGIVDQYYLQQRDNLGVNLPSPQGIGYRNAGLKVHYTWNVRDDLTLTPSLARQDHRPWWTESFLDVGFTQFSAHRDQGALDLFWEANPAFSLAAGLMARQDTAHSDSSANPFTFQGGRRRVTYRTQAAHVELQHQGWVNLTAGARYEHFSQAGQTLVPRFALTRTWGSWHLKLLTARSFHAPSIMNQNQVYAPGIRVEPERTRTSEVEVGWTQGNSLLTVNAFDIVLDRPIVFDQGPQDPNGGNGGYRNLGRLASRGLEVDYRLRLDGGFLNLGLATHRAIEAEDTYGVPGDASRFLGVADRKATLLAGWRLSEQWSLGGSLLHLGPRKGFAYDPAVGGLALRSFPSRLYLGAQATYTQGQLTLSLGRQDALDQGQTYLQAYDGGKGPLPGPGAQWVLKLRHGF